MSEPVAREATRRRLTAKQADTVDRLGRSAVDVLSREGFAGLTIRMVAAEAGVGAATARGWANRNASMAKFAMVSVMSTG